MWNEVVAIPRNKFEVFFGFGLSNKSFQGLPIDSNWLATYFDQGLFGCLVCASLLIFLFIAASFVPRGAPRAIALFLATYTLVASLTETGFSDASSYLLELTLAAAMVAAAGAGSADGQDRGMRVLQVHNRYRSAAPSGENRVVDRERTALAALGHEVTTFGQSSDEIEGWSRLQQAALPARVVWSRAARRDLGRELAARKPDVVHLHNTFPLLSPSVLYACRDAGVPVVATLHNYKLACASGDFFRNGTVCHDCAGHPPGRPCCTAATAAPGRPPRRSR